MYSALESTTFVSPRNVRLENHYQNLNIRHEPLAVWLGQDAFSPLLLCKNPGDDIDESFFQDCSSFNCTCKYWSVTGGVGSFDLSNSTQPLFDLCNDHNNNNDSLYNYNSQFREVGIGVGYHQIRDNGYADNDYNTTYPINISSDIYNAIDQPATWGDKMRMNPSYGSENSSTNKVGRYSVEEKRDRILRYLKKKNQRNFRKTTKYACRKTLADRRVRIRGRFAKNHEEDILLNQEDEESIRFAYNDYTKNDDYVDKNWLNEAMEAFMS